MAAGSTLTASAREQPCHVNGNSANSANGLRVAILTNFIPPYQKAVLDCLAARYGSLRVFLSTPMEPNRPWKAEWQGLDVVVQKTITLAGRWRHPSGFSERLAVHFPLDTVQKLLHYRADVVISGEMGARTLSAAIYRKLRRNSRLIVWADVTESTEKGRGFWRSAARRLLHRHVDAFLAVGESGVRYVQSLGVGGERIFKLSYATDVSRFAAGPILQEQGEARKLLYVGQLIERKGLASFIDILSEWAEANPGRPIEFTLAGGGPERRALEQMKVAPGIKLIFPGVLQYDDLPRVYGQAGIFVLPTLADTWAVVVNESMAAGLPVLGSVHAQAVNELVVDEWNGWRFRPDHRAEVFQAIDRMMNAPAGKLAEMRCNARKTALNLTPNRVAGMIDAAVSASLPIPNTAGKRQSAGN